MTLNKRTLIVRLAAFTFALFLPSSLAAQSRPNPPSRNSPVPSSSDAMREMVEREMKIRRLEMDRENNKKPSLQPSKETIKQVNEDFARIQGINEEIMRDYVGGTPPDYKRISEAMSEIRKRAARLQTNLLLPASGDIEGEPAASGSAIKRPGRSPLLDLNDVIFSFVTNPIFKNADTIDLALGLKAKRDLASIVDLSDRISRSADKLNKTSRASR